MEVLDFLKEYDRMCKSYKNCEDCPMCDEEPCPAIYKEKAKKIIQFVEQWSKDHPQKTRKQDFFEKHPDANTFENGFPSVCCCELGYCQECKGMEITCVDCWNTPMEDK